MTGRLDGKVAVITGGASGIGESTVRRFVAEGARCVVADLQEQRARSLVAELGEATRFIRVDVTTEPDVAAAADLAVSEFGALDCMFNNAGVLGAIGPIVDTTAQAWDASIAVLLRGVFLGIKHAARVMIPQGRGVILCTASTAGVRAGLGPHAYTAAKHAVVGLTQSVAPELARHGIRTNCIAPGGVVTALTSFVVTGDVEDAEATGRHIAERSPMGRAGTGDEIASVAVFLASDEAWLVNGAVVVVDGAAEVIGSASRGFSESAPAHVGRLDRRSPE